MTKPKAKVKVFIQQRFVAWVGGLHRRKTFSQCTNEEIHNIFSGQEKAKSQPQQIPFYRQAIGKKIKDWSSQVLKVMRINRISIVLVRAGIGAICLENSLTLSSRVEWSWTLYPSNSAPEYIHLRETYISLTGSRYLKMYNCIVFHSKTLTGMQPEGQSTGLE